MTVGSVNTQNVGAIGGTPNAAKAAPAIVSKEAAEKVVPTQQPAAPTPGNQNQVAEAVRAAEKPALKTADGEVPQTPRDERAVLAIGEVIEPTPTNNKAAKTYYHRFPGSCTFLPNGAQVIFAAGRTPDGQVVGKFTSDDPDVIKHLDSIVDVRGTNCYSIAEVKEDPMEKLVAQKAADSKNNAEEANR